MISYPSMFLIFCSIIFTKFYDANGDHNSNHAQNLIIDSVCSIHIRLSIAVNVTDLGTPISAWY